MKKVLFATTALVATAGMAAADVTFGGYGRFGVSYQEDAVNELAITSRFRLQIEATAETDAGITFGARVRIQQDNDDQANEVLPGVQPDGAAHSGSFSAREGTGINGVRWFARTGGLEVGVGNIFGAIDSMPGLYVIDLGLTGGSYQFAPTDGHAAAYSSDDEGAAGRNGIEVMYSIGNFQAHLSYDETDKVAGDGQLGNDRIAAHGAYTFDTGTLGGVTVALGLQDSEIVNDTKWVASVTGELGIAEVGFSYADNRQGGDHWALSGGIEVGAATRLEAYVAQDDAQAEEEAYGIGFHHDLGGGVALRGGVESEFGTTRGDLGVRFSF